MTWTCAITYRSCSNFFSEMNQIGTVSFPQVVLHIVRHRLTKDDDKESQTLALRITTAPVVSPRRLCTRIQNPPTLTSAKDLTKKHTVHHCFELSKQIETPFSRSPLNSPHMFSTPTIVHHKKLTQPYLNPYYPATNSLLFLTPLSPTLLRPT